ncbi:MAG: uL15m family ribosomal protein [bacterium]|nr:uL15m family ribosomal protein [bacterium]
MQTHQLKRSHKNYKAARVGRGGKRGKTSGRGTKGQLARSGHKLRPQLRDTIKKIPKLRGRGRNFLKSRQKIALVVNVGLLDKHFNADETVNVVTLKDKGLIRPQRGIISVLKILGQGEISKKLIVSGCLVSAGARTKIEKAGGVIETRDSQLTTNDIKK